jgi:hypothetical protein
MFFLISGNSKTPECRNWTIRNREGGRGKKGEGVGEDRGGWMNIINA